MGAVQRYLDINMKFTVQQQYDIITFFEDKRVTNNADLHPHIIGLDHSHNDCSDLISATLFTFES